MANSELQDVLSHDAQGSVQETSLIKNRYLRILFPPAVLSFLTFLIYYPSLYYPFQFDDIANIAKRFSIRFDNPLSRWWSSPRWFGDWLNSVNFQIGRFDPFYYRLINVTIHIITGICVFYLVRDLCLCLRKKPFFYNNAMWIGFVCSGLFLLHPVQTQTVSYVIQARLEGLATLFVLATLLTYVRLVFAQTKIVKCGLFALLLLFGMLSCGTKELVVVVPFLLLMIDWFFLAQEEWALFKKRLLWIGVFVSVFVLLIIKHMGMRLITEIFSFNLIIGNNRGNILTPVAFDIITPWKFFISELRVLLHYLTIFLWPFNMSVEYDWKMAPGFFSFEVLVPGIILSSMLWFVVRSMWNKRNIATSFGLLWFFISMAPRTTIVPSPELVCDYKTYLASFGVLFILATALVWLFTFVWEHLKAASPLLWAREVRLGVLAVLVLCVGATAYQRNRVWESSVVFWEDNVKKAPLKARVHNNFGVALSEVGRYDESIVEYQKAISLDAHYADPLSNLAVAYSLKGDTDKAIESLRGAIHICPNYPEAYNNLGTLLLQKKQYEDAQHSLEVAIQLRPYYGKAYYNLARMYEEKGDHEKSWENLKRATEGDLDIPEVLFKLGQMSLKIKKYHDAVVAFEKVIQHGGGQDQVWFNLANAHYMLGHHEPARLIYERLVRDNPLDPRFAYNLAETYFTQNKFAQAHEMFRKTTMLPQPIPQAFFRAAHCLERMNRTDEAKAFLNEMLTLNAADDFKKAVRSELSRMTLQKKVADGKGKITLTEFKKAIALSKDPNEIGLDQKKQKSKKV